MAIYSLHISNVSRANNSNACATLSYISGEKVRCDSENKTFDYGRPQNRRERVKASKTLLPKNAPVEFINNASAMFNSIEEFETAGNARTAKKFMMALPNELTLEQAQQVVDLFVEKNFVKNGYGCTYSIHCNPDGSNLHVHGLLPNRPFNKDGSWGTKRKTDYVYGDENYVLDRDGNKMPIFDKETGLQKVDENGNWLWRTDTRIQQIDIETGLPKFGKRNEVLWKRRSVDCNPLDQKSTLMSIRKSWADICNEELAKIDPQLHIDERSFKTRGAKVIKPTIHEGYAAREMEKDGKVSRRCQYNRNIKAINFNNYQLRREEYKIDQEKLNARGQIQEAEVNLEEIKDTLENLFAAKEEQRKKIPARPPRPKKGLIKPKQKTANKPPNYDVGEWYGKLTRATIKQSTASCLEMAEAMKILRKYNIKSPTDLKTELTKCSQQVYPLQSKLTELEPSYKHALKIHETYVNYDLDMYGRKKDYKKELKALGVNPLFKSLDEVSETRYKLEAVYNKVKNELLPVKFKQEEIARAANIINCNIKKTTQPRIRSFTENYPKKHVSPLHNYCPQQSLTSAQRLQFQREFIPLEYANEVKNYKLQQRADELAAALNPPKPTQDPPTITPRVENKAVRNDSVASNSEQSQQIKRSAPTEPQQPAPVPTQQPAQAPQAQAQGERVKPKRVPPSEHIAQMTQRADSHNSNLNSPPHNQNRGAR